MLDLNALRKEYEKICKNINLRQKNYPALEEFKTVDQQWRQVATMVQDLNTRRNELSAKVAELMKSGNKDEAEQIKNQVKDMKAQIEAGNIKFDEYKAKMNTILFSIPNLLDESVPYGKDETENKELKKFLEPTKFDFTPKAHFDLGVEKGMLDFERGQKITGTRGYILTNSGARLMRALRDFTLDMHNDAGYSEIMAPVILNDQPLYGLGKLPLFKEDMYETVDGQFLVGTEEHSLTAMYMNETIDSSVLPIKITSSSINFRKEAGAAGKDTRGILRVHQFYNTELINLALPEQSWDLLEQMRTQAESVLESLQIPYRTILLCSGDTGDSAAKTYDIEVWMPASNMYREISSCSNCLDYQARGLGIKFKNKGDVGYAHTLNGTGTSLNRLWIAVVENFQQADSSISVPKALQRYLNGQETI